MHSCAMGLIIQPSACQHGFKLAILGSTGGRFLGHGACAIFFTANRRRYCRWVVHTFFMRQLVLQLLESDMFILRSRFPSLSECDGDALLFRLSRRTFCFNVVANHSPRRSTL